ncbi:MAG TPA: PspC domain-containing protein, partial [Candidatus Kapabacteria bacterium]|nr:PspC domain-containing protein [Candidatus Kapabacteria bacterium]
RRVLPQLELSAAFTKDSNGFDTMARQLLDRFKSTEGVRFLSAALAFLMLFYALTLQLSHINEPGFHAEHPWLSWGMTMTEQMGGVIAYLALGLLFFFTDPTRTALAAFWQQPRPRLELDATSSRLIFGLMSGLSRVTNVDPIILRVLMMLVSMLTFGVGAVAYVVAVILLDKRSKELHPPHAHDVHARAPRFSPRLLRSIGVIFLILSVTMFATEFRLFFFNEPYIHGLLHGILGLMIFVWAFRRWDHYSGARLWMLLSPAMIFWAIYELTMALFYVQLPFVARFQVGYLIAGTVFIYYSIVALRGRAILYGISIGIFFYLLVMLVQFNIIPSSLLLLLVQFFEFFYPVIFAGAGLWVVMEK